MAGIGVFDDDAIIRRLYREHVMVLAGPRALLMQAAHPVAFAGFYAQTAAKDEPYERLHRTAQIVELVVYGERREAERATRRVRAMHRRVRGELAEPAGRFPAGTPYAADDPELLMWILATLVDSGLVVYQRYVRGLTPGERESLWQDYRIFGRMFGVPDDVMPAIVRGLRAATCAACCTATTCTSRTRRVQSRKRDRHAPAGAAARRAHSSSWRTSSPSGCCRRRSAAGTASPGTPPAASRCCGHTEYARRVLVPLLPRRLRYNARRHLRVAA